MVGISTGFDCCGQSMLVYHMVLSFMDNNDWYSSVFFLSWTIMVGIATVFVCHGQLLLV